jgi:hypothetical protein
MYRWVDEKSEVRYSDRPPEQSEVEKVDLRESKTTGIQPGETNTESVETPSAAEQSRQSRKEKWDAAKASKKEMAKICEKNREIVETIEPHSRVLTETEDGTIVRMDDNERLSRVAAAKEQMAANCKD